MSNSPRTSVGLLLACVLVVGCAPLNQARSTHPASEPFYEPGAFKTDPRNTDDLFIALALSGGGTRAASLSYGVLDVLHRLPAPGVPRRSLLSEVDLLSSVSGGSFTAAYYTLFGDRLFEDFKQRFLLRNIERDLALNVFLPPTAFRHFSPYFDRIDAAASIYDRILFDRKTFRDLALRKRKPLVVLNATNMSLGTPFDFTEEQFEAIGSDLSSYPIGWAVASSSAFPFLLSPVTLKNFGSGDVPQWVQDALEDGPEFRESYLRAQAWKETSDSKAHPWLHLLDGGLADNIGARFITRSMSVTGGWLQQLLARRKVRQLLIVTVNAQTPPDTSMDERRPGPGLVDVLFRTSSVAMDNYTDDTIEQVTQVLREYRNGALVGGEDGCGGQPLCNICYFPVPSQRLELFVVNVDLDQLPDARMREEAWKVPTNFNLSRQQVDLMIHSGQTLLEKSPCFQLFLQRSNVQLSPT